MMIRRFDFQHINLIPRKCIVNSRMECNTSLKFGNHTFNMPIMPANMECVINDDIAIKLASNNYFYVHHRFNNDVVEFSKKMRKLNLPVSISVGVNDDAYKTLKDLFDANLFPDYVTIDIAHGHSIKMEKILNWIKSSFFDEPFKKPFIIAGNVSTPEAVVDLENWGADAIKVGIGPGSACTTFNATGFGSRGCQASVIRDCAAAKKKAFIIADGGIKDAGDIAKSLVLGADMVMIGGMFSGLIDSPGALVKGEDGRMYKEFWGSASAYQSGKKDRIEGTKKLLLLQHHEILDEFKYLKESLQSAISYGGGKDLSCLKEIKYM